MTRPIRVVVAKPGLDGHDRGAKIIARARKLATLAAVPKRDAALRDMDESERQGGGSNAYEYHMERGDWGFLDELGPPNSRDWGHVLLWQGTKDEVRKAQSLGARALTSTSANRPRSVRWCTLGRASTLRSYSPAPA